MRYTVLWRRSLEPDAQQKCSGLTVEMAFRRLRRAIASSGPIIIDAIAMETNAQTPQD